MKLLFQRLSAGREAMVLRQSPRLLRRHLLLGLAAGPLLLAGGCAGLAARGDRSPAHVFGLSDIRPSGGAAVSWQLVVAEPTISAVLNRSRIALQRDDGQFAYFADASWSDQLGSLVRLVLLQSFGNSGRIRGLAEDTLTLRADYQLRTSVRSFQANYHQTGQPPECRVVIAVQLVRLPERLAVAASHFAAARVAERDAMAAIASALDAAFAEVQGQIVEWTMTAAEADYARQS
ncbi:MAG TPA: ABC-type transport auxiliary lipoprotein family protein [Kiloniellales bacterium]|nr:ABC-type transport auxiliary lipoprotein family protein [Kiloniellales bacterium]